MKKYNFKKFFIPNLILQMYKRKINLKNFKIYNVFMLTLNYFFDTLY